MVKIYFFISLVSLASCSNHLDIIGTNSAKKEDSWYLSEKTENTFSNETRQHSADLKQNLIIFSPNGGGGVWQSNEDMKVSGNRLEIAFTPWWVLADELVKNTFSKVETSKELKNVSIDYYETNRDTAPSRTLGNLLLTICHQGTHKNQQTLPAGYRGFWDIQNDISTPIIITKICSDKSNLEIKHRLEAASEKFGLRTLNKYDGTNSVLFYKQHAAKFDGLDSELSKNSPTNIVQLAVITPYKSDMDARIFLDEIKVNLKIDSPINFIYPKTETCKKFFKSPYFSKKGVSLEYAYYAEDLKNGVDKNYENIAKVTGGITLDLCQVITAKLRRGQQEKNYKSGCAAEYNSPTKFSQYTHPDFIGVSFPLVKSANNYLDLLEERGINLDRMSRDLKILSCFDTSADFDKLSVK